MFHILQEVMKRDGSDTTRYKEKCCDDRSLRESTDATDSVPTRATICECYTDTDEYSAYDCYCRRCFYI